MAKTKISEFNTDPALNTDIDSINIAEGCAPSGINNAIRELMSQLKNQQSGTDGDSFTVGGNLTVLAQGDVRLSDADSSNYVALQAPTTLAANYTLTMPTADGTSSQAIKTDGAGTLSFGNCVSTVGWTGGIVSVATATTTPALTVAGTSGGIPYFSSGSTWTSSSALTANAIVVGGGAGAAPATVTTGTGVVTALGVNTGSAGAFVVNGELIPATNGGTGLTTPGTSGNFLQSNGSTWISTAVTPSISLVVSSRTSNTILGSSDNSTLINVTSGTFTQTISAVSGLAAGWYCYYRNTGTGVVTIDPNSSELIGGVTTAVCNPGDIWLIQSTGTAFLLSRLVGNNSVIYTSGSNTFTVPAGVYRIYAECWGGGGGVGGGGQFAGGAGGGGYVAGWINVTPGSTITGTVGAGGTTSGSPGGDGGQTTFSTFTAGGGAGGVSGANNAAGGTATGGTINIVGGIGGSQAINAYVSAFGAGGSAANGGLGFVGCNATNGGIPGGGAGGAGNASTFTGGRGQINVSWV
jgi:hypothetical protein